MEELQPCPLCGAEPYLYEGLVHCPITRCALHNYKFSPEDWNTRPIEDALRVAYTRVSQKIASLCPEISNEANQQNVPTIKLVEALNSFSRRVHTRYNMADALIEQLRTELARKDELIDALEEVWKCEEKLRKVVFHTLTGRNSWSQKMAAITPVEDEMKAAHARIAEVRGEGRQ